MEAPEVDVSIISQSRRRPDCFYQRLRGLCVRDVHCRPERQTAPSPLQTPGAAELGDLTTGGREMAGALSRTGVHP